MTSMVERLCFLLSKAFLLSVSFQTRRTQYYLKDRHKGENIEFHQLCVVRAEQIKQEAKSGDKNENM